MECLKCERKTFVNLAVQCGDCLRYAHLSCAGINDLELIFIKRLEKAWYCHSCLATTFERKPTFRRPATERYKRAIIANKKSPLIETDSDEATIDHHFAPKKDFVSRTNLTPNSSNLYDFEDGEQTTAKPQFSVKASSTNSLPNRPTRIPQLNIPDNSSASKSHDFGRPSKLAYSSLNPPKRNSEIFLAAVPKKIKENSLSDKQKASKLSRKPIITKGERPTVKQEPSFIEKLKTLRPVGIERSNALQSMRRSVSETSVFHNDITTRDSQVVEQSKSGTEAFHTITEIDERPATNGSTILKNRSVNNAERKKIQPRPKSVIEPIEDDVPPFIQKLNSLKPVKDSKSSSTQSLNEPTDQPWDRPRLRRAQSEAVIQETTAVRKMSTQNPQLQIGPRRMNIPVVKTSSYAQFLKTYAKRLQNKQIVSTRSSKLSDYHPAEEIAPGNGFPSQEMVSESQGKPAIPEEPNNGEMVNATNGVNLSEGADGLRRHSGSMPNGLHNSPSNNIGILEPADPDEAKTQDESDNSKELPPVCNGFDDAATSAPSQCSVRKKKRNAPPVPALQNRSSESAIGTPLGSSIKVVNDHSVFNWFHEVSLGGIGILKSFNEAEETVDSLEGPQPENKVPNEARDAAVEKEHEIKRGHILAELLETERIYVSELESIVKGYKYPMLAEETRHLNSELDGKSDIIFGNLEEIYAFHNEIFLTDLENCISTTELVALCFTHRKDALHKLYSCYCQNTPRSERHREAIGDHPFLRTCQTKLGHKLPLAAYLLKPVQRITKYRLLLEDLLSHSEGKKWCCELQEALDCMLAVLKCVNDSMHQTAITGFWGDLGDLGDLLMQGGFSVWTESKKDRFKKELRLIKPMQRHLFLYQKALLMCKKTSVHSRFNYQFKKLIKMSDVGLTETVKDSKTFEVWLTGRSEVHTIQAATVEQKIEWVDQIKSLLLYQLTQLKMKQHSKAGRSMSLDHYHGRSSPRAFSCDEGKSSKVGAPSDEETASSDFSNSDDEETFTTQVSQDSNIAIISSQGSRYRVLADYTPFGHNELPMKEGDIVTLLKVGCAGWWYVRLYGEPVFAGCGDAGGKRFQYEDNIAKPQIFEASKTHITTASEDELTSRELVKTLEKKVGRQLRILNISAGKPRGARSL